MNHSANIINNYNQDNLFIVGALISKAICNNDIINNLFHNKKIMSDLLLNVERLSLLDTSLSQNMRCCDVQNKNIWLLNCFCVEI